MNELTNAALSTTPRLETVPEELEAHSSATAPALAHHLRRCESSNTQAAEVKEMPSICNDGLREDGRPQIDSPKEFTRCSNTLLMMILAQLDLEKLEKSAARVFDEEITLDLEEMQKLQKQHAKIIKEATKAEQSASTWSTLTGIATYLTSTSSLVIGAATAASGGSLLIATALMASAGLGLTNKIVHDTIGWNTVASYFSSVKETQKKLEEHIQMTFTVTALVLGVYGSMNVMGQMAHLVNSHGTRILQTGLQTFTAGTNFKRTTYEARESRLKAKEIRVNHQVKEKQLQMAVQMNDMQTPRQMMQNLARHTGQLIQQRSQIARQR